MANVSVIIPCYNAEKTIRETIESVLAQTYQDLEIIVVDDGSTDGSKEIIQSFGNNVHYIYQENSGQSAAQNTGIRAAKGDYVAFIDADDLWLPEKIEKQLTVLKKTKTSWCYCDCLIIENDREKVVGKYSELIHKPYEGDVLTILLFGNFIASVTPIVSTELLLQCGLFDESPDVRIGQDWEHWLRIAAKAKISYVPEPLAIHRVHEVSMTYHLDPQVSFSAHQFIVEKVTSLFEEQLTPLKDKVLAHYAYVSSKMYWLNGEFDLALSMINRALIWQPGNYQYLGLRFLYSLPYLVSKQLLRIRKFFRA